MGKYIDADLLRKEIEKHIKEVKDAAERFTPNMGFFDAKLSGIYDVMAIIDSLQQENGSNNFYDEVDIKASKEGFIAGAEWMRSQMPMPEDTVIFMKGVEEGRRLEREDWEENKRKEDELPRYYGD